jgi:hypothetical protein
MSEVTGTYHSLRNLRSYFPSSLGEMKTEMEVDEEEEEVS